MSPKGVSLEPFPEVVEEICDLPAISRWRKSELRNTQSLAHVLADRVSQLVDLPYCRHTAAAILGLEVLHLVIVCHFAEIGPPRYGDRDLAQPLDEANGITGVSDHDIG
jgi:hypothetical protein